MAPAPLERILETALYVDDLDAAVAFYGGLLGLDCTHRVPGRHAFFRLGAAMLLLFDPEATRVAAGGALPVPPHGDEPGRGHVCFAADAAALDAWTARLRGAEVAIEADFRWPNGARSVYLRDPAGNSVELAEPRLWDFA